jgi:hypothetical protein
MGPTRQGWLARRQFECPLLALSGHAVRTAECPLSGVKRTSLFAAQVSGFDPKRTSVGQLGVSLNRAIYVAVTETAERW